MNQGKYTGRTLDGKYRVQDLLGEGGMGAVYLGEHVLIGRKVAVKFLHESLLANEEAIRRFYREGQTAASIGHRNVVDILDVGVSAEGEPYLVMEYLEGEGLADLIARRGALDLPAAAAILEQVLAALAAAHERGVVHRDLKPDNVFLERQRSGAPGIKLIDFGISKIREGAGTQLTLDGSMMGTPAYMSPEQIRNSKDVDGRTDLYAAGAIFYEMLAGAPPYAGEQYSEVLSNVLTLPPRDPGELREDFPREAWPFIERALAKDPAQRFGTADEMMAALAELVEMGERAVSLTLLGAAMPAGTFAAGDLGPAPVGGETVLAAEILGRVVEERTGAPAWKRLLRRAAAGIPELRRLPGRVVAAVPDWKRHARRVVAEPRLRLRVAAGGGGAVLVVVLLAALCSGGDVVTIEVVGAPLGARIYWEDSLVPANPFHVDRGEALRSLRVEAAGHRPARLSVQPDEDRTIEVDLKPEKKTSRKAAGRSEEAKPGEKEPGMLGEPGAAPAPDPAGEGNAPKGQDSKPAKKRRKFPKLPWQK